MSDCDQVLWVLFYSVSVIKLLVTSTETLQKLCIGIIKLCA